MAKHGKVWMKASRQLSCVDDNSFLLLYYIRADLYRYVGECGWQAFAKNMLNNPGFQFTFWLRCRFLGRERPFVAASQEIP